MSAIGSVAFGVGRVLFLEVGTASTYESGVQAYYAAESGIEEGFLRYRYNQDDEIPANDSWLVSGKAERVDVTSSTIVANPADISSAPASDKQVYDFRIGSRTGSFGADSDLANFDPNSPFYIPRDESKKFKVDLSKNNKIVLQMRPRNPSGASNPAPLNDYRCFLVEIKVVGKLNKSSTQTVERKALFDNGICSYADKVKVNDATPYVWDGTNAIIDGIKAAWPGVQPLQDAEMQIKPIGDDITFRFYADDGSKIYGPTADIESTGYYDGTSKKLAANIDRQVGTLYDLFDYVIYKGN